MVKGNKNFRYKLSTYKIYKIIFFKFNFIEIKNKIVNKQTVIFKRKMNRKINF